MVPTLKRSREKAQCRGCWLLLHTCEKENSCNTQMERKQEGERRDEKAGSKEKMEGDRERSDRTRRNRERTEKEIKGKERENVGKEM